MNIEIGDNILLFQSVEITQIRNNYDNFTIGRVVNILSNSDSIYEVMDSNGMLHRAVHLYPKHGSDYYVRTIDEHVKSLYDYLDANKEMIMKLTEESERLESLISSLNANEKTL